MVFSHSSNIHRIGDLYLLYLLARYNAPGIKDLYLVYLLARYNAPGIRDLYLVYLLARYNAPGIRDLYLVYLLARYNTPGIMAVLLENVHLNIHALHTTDKQIWYTQPSHLRIRTVLGYILCNQSKCSSGLLSLVQSTPH